MPSQLFYSVTIPVSLWILRKGKEGNSRGKVLFIDARNLGYMADRKVRELSEEDIGVIANTYNNWRKGLAYSDVQGFCKEVSNEELGAQDYILTPGRYVGMTVHAEDNEPYADKVVRLTNDLSAMFEESSLLQKEIISKIELLGFDTPFGGQL